MNDNVGKLINELVASSAAKATLKEIAANLHKILGEKFVDLASIEDPQNRSASTWQTPFQALKPLVCLSFIIRKGISLR